MPIEKQDALELSDDSYSPLSDVLREAVATVEKRKKAEDRFAEIIANLAKFITVPETVEDHIALYVHQNRNALALSLKRKFGLITSLDINNTVLVFLMDKLVIPNLPEEVEKAAHSNLFSKNKLARPLTITTVDIQKIDSIDEFLSDVVASMFGKQALLDRIDGAGTHSNPEVGEPTSLAEVLKGVDTQDLLSPALKVALVRYSFRIKAGEQVAGYLNKEDFAYLVESLQAYFELGRYNSMVSVINEYDKAPIDKRREGIKLAFGLMILIYAIYLVYGRIDNFKGWLSLIGPMIVSFIGGGFFLKANLNFASGDRGDLEERYLKEPSYENVDALVELLAMIIKCRRELTRVSSIKIAPLEEKVYAEVERILMVRVNTLAASAKKEIANALREQESPRLLAAGQQFDEALLSLE